MRAFFRGPTEACTRKFVPPNPSFGRAFGGLGLEIFSSRALFHHLLACVEVRESLFLKATELVAGGSLIDLVAFR